MERYKGKEARESGAWDSESVSSAFQDSKREQFSTMTQAKRRAGNYEEIKPLVMLCKHGRLFDVQKWIAEGKPIDTPLPEPKKARKKGPIEIAIELGFHSMVQVLLEAGADIHDDRYNPLSHALGKRRLDLIELLVQHGADIHSVPMWEVFDTWQPEIMRFFIDRGADVETDQPLAGALIERIRTALGIYKQYWDRYPSFPDQLNFALRHHAQEGNAKWVSLLLWAGADPNKPGPWYSFDDEEDSFETAIELAVYYNHSHLFKIKKFQLDACSPRIQEVVRSILMRAQGEQLLDLIDEGFDPKSVDSDDLPMIQMLIRGLFERKQYSLFDFYDSNGLERMKMIHVLAREGVRWEPKDTSDFRDARKSFTSQSPDFTAEFIWIMSTYNACPKVDLLELLKTPKIKQHISKHQKRIRELIDQM